jgi:hypothetical protein
MPTLMCKPGSLFGYPQAAFLIIHSNLDTRTPQANGWLNN